MLSLKKQYLTSIKQSVMSFYDLDYLIISSNDEFMNSMTDNESKRINKICGFTGSNGILVLSKNEMYLFTDSRYLIQAKKQTECTIINIGECSLIKFFQTLDNNERVNIGLFSYLHPRSEIINFVNAVKSTSRYVFFLNHDDFDEKIYLKKEIGKKNNFFDISKYSGLDKEDKISIVLSKISKKADAIIISDPASLCWLLNIRGHDNKFAPFYNAYCILTRHGQYSVIKNPINNIIKELSNILLHGDCLQIDPNTISFGISEDLKNIGGYFFIEEVDPIIDLKTIKNDVEIYGSIKSHEADGVALCKFFYWLSNWQKHHDNNHHNTEFTIAQRIDTIRSEQNDFISLSFPTIVGFNANGAIIHYQPEPESASTISGNGTLLIDSGSQYYTGTTDVTRTIAIGNDVSEEVRHDFTLVLKGHIALASAIFPKGTTGSNLDCLARQFLWNEYKNYAHGTGHGVGYCSNVHEGPAGISQYNKCILKAGMIISNEPGLYVENHYGIRIENLMQVTHTANNDFLQFKIITMVPIDLRMIAVELLNNAEIDWIDQYHSRVLHNISPNLQGEELKWLTAATRQVRDV